MVLVSSASDRPWWCWCSSSLLVAVSVLLTLQCPSPLLERVAPLLLVYALMPSAADPAGSRGSRVRETKKALLGRSSRSSSVPVPVVAKGTVSKITEKFQTRPAALPRTARASAKNPVLRTSPPPLPPLPPPVVKYEIKRRQEKLLSELHGRGGVDRRIPSSRLPTRVTIDSGGSGGGDSAVYSDCGSSSDSEKSICCGVADYGPVETAIVDKPGSPHSSGYESVDEAVVVPVDDFVAVAAVPYSWVFGTSEHDGLADVAPPPLPLSPPPSSICSQSSSYEDDNAQATVAPEDRLERLVTFAPTASCPALTRAKPDQDGDGAPALVRRHFAGNDAATPNSASGFAGYLSPIPECSSTGPNSVETVEECYGDGHDKVHIADCATK